VLSSAIDYEHSGNLLDCFRGGVEALGDAGGNKADVAAIDRHADALGAGCAQGFVHGGAQGCRALGDRRQGDVDDHLRVGLSRHDSDQLLLVEVGGHALDHGALVAASDAQRGRLGEAPLLAQSFGQGRVLGPAVVADLGRSRGQRGPDQSQADANERQGGYSQ